MSAFACEVADLVRQHGFAKAYEIMRQRKEENENPPEPTMGDAYEGTQEEWDQWLIEWRRSRKKTT